MNASENHEGDINFDLGGSPGRAGFRVTEACKFAAGPIELEFFLEITGPISMFLLITSDWMRGRPGGFTIEATFAGTRLEDPCAQVSDQGGPAGVVEIAANRPWRQPMVLNEFVRLETVLNQLEPGDSGPLKISCQRPLPLALSEEDALGPSAPVRLIKVGLDLTLSRDDARLVAFVDRLIEDVVAGPRDRRERPLRHLLALRAPVAKARWKILAGHPDPAVAERVQQALLN